MMYGDMMGWGGGIGLYATLFSIVVLVDLVLLSFWLWKNIKK